MNKPIAYAAVATDASEAIYLTTDKEDAESMCRCEDLMLLPLHHLPVAWQEEAAAVDAAFQRSGVKRTWPDDEPDQIILMVNAMADEIELLRGYRDEAESDAAIAHLLVDKLRLTDAEVEVLLWLAKVGGDTHPALKTVTPEMRPILQGIVKRLGGGK